MIALITYEVTKALRAHGRVCAVELLASSPTSATWSLVAVECASLGSARARGAPVVVLTRARTAVVQRAAASCSSSALPRAQEAAIAPN